MTSPESMARVPTHLLQGTQPDKEPTREELREALLKKAITADEYSRKLAKILTPKSND